MGGGSKKSKVGSKYEMGFHLIPCRQADALLALRANDEPLWEGRQGQGSIAINKPDAFGGTEREGGFSGVIDVELGGNNQTINDYLSSVFGPLVSAHRGVVGLVYRRPYISANTARMPSISHKMLNIEGIHRGWNPDKIIVNSEATFLNSDIYIALDMTSSNSSATIFTLVRSTVGLLNAMRGKPNSVKLVTFSSNIIDSIERIDCSDQDYDDLIAFVEALDVSGTLFGGNWTNAVSEASAFFDASENFERDFDRGFAGSGLSFSGGEASEIRRKVIIYIVDGDQGDPTAAKAIIDGIGGVETFLFTSAGAITTGASLDTTPSDGIPFISGDGSSALINSLSNSFTKWADLNPSHIIRCLLTDPMRGGTVPESEIGDSFFIEAQNYIDEGFGISVKFRGVDQVIADRREIERHTDSISFKSTKTGKWEHKRIRDNFTVVELNTLDSSIVTDWSGLSRPELSEIPNQLTVTFTKRENGKKGSVTRTNPAGVRRQGRVIKAEPADYPFITKEDLAIKVCLRDLRSVSKRLWSGTIPLTYLPPDIEVGDRVILNEPLLRINNIVVVISEIRHGGSADARAWITVSEDKYSTPEVILPSEFGEVTTTNALPVQYRVVTETPYYLGVVLSGQNEIDDDLLNEPDLGRLLLTGGAPTGAHIDFTGGVDSGDGLQDVGVFDFEPHGVLVTEVPNEADFTVITITPNATLADIVSGDLAYLGDEIIRIDNLVENGTLIDVTVGRGCLDTVPQNHNVDDFFVMITDADPLTDDFLANQSVNVRLISRTGKNQLSISNAPEDNVIFNSRAIRPYPPGQFQVNGSYEQFNNYDNIVLTWAHRDRTFQTTPNVEDHTFSNIGPEIGVTYQLTVDAIDENNLLISNLLDVNLGSVTTYDWDDTTILPANTDHLRFQITSLRDGYSSWQSALINVSLREKLLLSGDMTDGDDALELSGDMSDGDDIVILSGDT